MEGKLLASVKYINPSVKWFCTFIGVIGLALPVVTVMMIFGDFGSFLNYDGNMLDRILADEDGLIFLIVFGAVIVLVPLLLASARISIHVYESYVVFKWARLAKAVKVEYSQIQSIQIGKFYAPGEFASNGLVGVLVTILFWWVKTFNIQLSKSEGVPEKIMYIIGGGMSRFNRKKAEQIRSLILERIR